MVLQLATNIHDAERGLQLEIAAYCDCSFPMDYPPPGSLQDSPAHHRESSIVIAATDISRQHIEHTNAI